MKVRDLLKMEIDIDVYDDVCEEIGVCFCGAMELTEYGERRFADVLDLDVELVNSGCSLSSPVAILKIDSLPEWRDILDDAGDLFYGMAGYCSQEDYDKWFKEV